LDYGQSQQNEVMLPEIFIFKRKINFPMSNQIKKISSK